MALQTTAVYNLLLPDCKARIQYCRLFQESVFNGFNDPGLMIYSDEAWFTLSGYIQSQNNSQWSKENPHAVHEMPLHK
jgi:hypothetical protein